MLSCGRTRAWKCVISLLLCYLGCVVTVVKVVCDLIVLLMYLKGPVVPYLTSVLKLVVRDGLLSRPCLKTVISCSPGMNGVRVRNMKRYPGYRLY